MTNKDNSLLLQKIEKKENIMKKIIALIAVMFVMSSTIMMHAVLGFGRRKAAAVKAQPMVVSEPERRAAKRNLLLNKRGYNPSFTVMQAGKGATMTPKMLTEQKRTFEIVQRGRQQGVPTAVLRKQVGRF